MTAISVALPEAILNQARQLRGGEDAYHWQAGDLCASVIAELKHKASKTEIRETLAGELGLSRSTLRRDEWVATSYDEADRAEFETLTFGYYHAALSAPKPLEALAWCIESADDFGGKPAPLDRLKAQIKIWKDGAEPTNDEKFERARRRAESALNTMLTFAPGHKEDATRALLTQLEKLEGAGN